jgi:endonuclease/exonuclease/phosphatase family metal-dependent hydrolase
MAQYIKSFTQLVLASSFIAFAATSCKKAKNETGEFTALTYNVAGLPAILSSSVPEINTTPIGKLLNDYDIVHVQEDFCYHDSLLLNARHPYITTTLGCVPDGDGLNTFSKFSILNFQRIKWNDCADADCYTPKGFSYSQIEIAPGITVDFYNAHVQAKTHPTAMAARRKNIIQFCAYVKEHSEGRPVIIMGDMNSRYTRDTIAAVLSLGFGDSWVQQIRNGSVPEFGAPALTDCDANKNIPDCEKVDKIFYRSSTKVKLTPVAYQLDDSRYYLNGNDSFPLSDHWPLLTRFKYEIVEE